MEPGSKVLRNRLGITDAEALASAENDLVEFRLAQLREQPLLVPRGYNLPHLQALHRHLFQDVYEWAGDLRTVGIAKGGGEPFMPPAEIDRPVAHVASKIQETDCLRSLTDDALAEEIAYLYDYLNFAHPFREGNGRAQREFFAQLLSESRRGLAWQRVETTELHGACHVARNQGNLTPLIDLFGAIITKVPSY